MNESAWLEQWLQLQRLPATLGEDVQQHLLPWLQQELHACGHTLILGIHGCQGSGKSTLAALLREWAQQHGLQAVCLSLDDYYLSRRQRRVLAKRIHPLLATRGVPGTHDIHRLRVHLHWLRQGRTGFALPRFLKHRDDPAPFRTWPVITEKPRLVLFEGWCLGLPPLPIRLLQPPVNRLEAIRDPDGRWRAWVNRQLAGPYRPVWGLVDRWLMLRAPDFSCVERWRWQQEEHLRHKLQQTEGRNARTLDRPALKNFLMHFQRWTEHGLQALPPRVHRCLWLNGQRRIIRATGGSGRVGQAAPGP